jgi:chromosome segregation ATPase
LKKKQNKKMNQNQNQYKQFIQNMKNQHVQYVNRIKILETELNKCKEDGAQNSNVLKLENIQLKEIFNSDVEKKSQQLDFANNKLKELSAELDAKTAELDATTEDLHAKTEELHAKTAELDAKTTELDAKTAELDAKTAELECSNKKINEMLGDLDKKNDAFHNIDKIIFRNNEYFDEIKKELNDKIAHNKEVDELYKKTTDELHTIRTELESAYKELDITKTELQLYKNDFILKSATF